MASTTKLTAQLKPQGMLRFVFVSDEVVTKVCKSDCLQVIVTVGKVTARTSFVPAGSGQWKLFLNGDLRKAAGIHVGDTVDITLESLQGSPDLPIPPAFHRVLEARPGGIALFFKQTTAKRNEIIRYVGEAKKESTQKRRAHKCLDTLAKLS